MWLCFHRRLLASSAFFLIENQLINTKNKMEQKKRPIDNVTVDNLDIALRMCKIQIDKSILDRIIDLVELIEEKADETSISDVCKLQEEWKQTIKNTNQ